jgi:PBSX family phage terminase large subunit
MEEILRINLHPFQSKAFFSKARFILLQAGLQSGKTLCGVVWARTQYDTYEKLDGLICAPTYKILSQSTLPKFFEINKDLKKFYKKGDSTIEVPGRGIIYIRSTENPNVIEGMTLKWIWADEGGQMKYDAWVNMQGRVSILQGKVFITTTPYTFNWLKEINDLSKTDSNYEVVKFRSIDNPYFPKEEYERVKKNLEPRIFRRRYEGEMERLEGLVYDSLIPNLHIIGKKNIKFKEVIAGVDWGYTHYTAIPIIGITDENIYYIIDEYCKSEKTTAEIIEALKNYQSLYNIRYIYPDPEAPDKIEEMRRAGVMARDVLKNKDSIVNGIDKIRELFRTQRLYIFDTCVHTVEGFNLYRYPDQDKIDRNELPLKEDDDMMDAIRYAISNYQGMTMPQFNPSFTKQVFK